MDTKLGKEYWHSAKSGRMIALSRRMQLINRQVQIILQEKHQLVDIFIANKLKAA